ncbi:hypothetical protein CP556_08825 [Natrinema sp. CBA1119]|uniref:hypothetical protein n=1 Tax=Natrinema sp. CBA1119 TaxID=1608465 RepID=UPI000BF689EC|nr:hypothetical protein [Natrinema sp. CBA1119]PGF16205.1 hypothetical protein CP556_08825 [Natrinema sp. CBA1119]
MSSTEISEEVAARQRRRAREMAIGEISRHIREESWPIRVGVDADLRDVWRRAEPVYDPSAANGCVTRLDLETETLLLARQGGLVTCKPLEDRSQTDRRYIRNQVTTDE